MNFLGIDLGWYSGASGLCCLSWQDGQLQLLSLERKEAIADILIWVESFAPISTPALVAVDAPTRIGNATGMRLADKLTHKHFGRYDAGCYPANLARPFAQRTVEFGLSLEALGFVHAPQIDPYIQLKASHSPQLARYQIEVFPHPAIVNLFGRDRILKYKKGKLAERRIELAKLRQYIVELLPTFEPRLSLAVQLPEIPTTGKSLKAVEDQLDSLICAYIAAYWWYWGTEKNWVLGDPAEGYIVVPKSDELRRECSVNNLRLIIQPLLLFGLIYPWLDIFPYSDLLRGFNH